MYVLVIDPYMEVNSGTYEYYTSRFLEQLSRIEIYPENQRKEVTSAWLPQSENVPGSRILRLGIVVGAGFQQGRSRGIGLGAGTPTSDPFQHSMLFGVLLHGGYFANLMDWEDRPVHDYLLSGYILQKEDGTIELFCDQHEMELKKHFQDNPEFSSVLLSYLKPYGIDAISTLNPPTDGHKNKARKPYLRLAPSEALSQVALRNSNKFLTRLAQVKGLNQWNTWRLKAICAPLIVAGQLVDSERVADQLMSTQEERP